jgi:hypothetical protein
MSPKKIVSAQAVLASAGGKRPGPETRITSENIRAWEPSAEAIARVSSALRGMGFEVGECVGNSMSITGSVRLFESSFDTKLQEAGRSVKFAEQGYELAQDKIPAALRGDIAAITFSPPPDFGPGAASFG